MKLQKLFGIIMLMFLFFSVVSGEAWADSVLQLPEKLQVIEEEAFYGDKRIEEVVLGSHVTTIESLAFAESSVAQIEIPNSVTHIADDAFSGCDQVLFVCDENSEAYRFGLEHENIIVFGKPTAQENFTWSILDEDHAAVTGYVGTEKVFSVPATYTAEESGKSYVVSEIASNAFKGNKAIESVSLSDSITTVQNSAFQGCTNLKDVRFGQKINLIGVSAFYGCTNLKEALLPDSVTTIGTSAYTNCVNLTTFRYPAGLKTILPNGSSGYIFSGCAKLESITVPEGVTKIPDYTFLRADYLKYVDLPDSLKEIGRSAFSECKAITELDLPDGLEIIAQSAFSDCTNLKEALLPDSVTTIGTSAYTNCVNLTTFRYPAGLKTILPNGSSGYIFSGCAKLESITVPEGVTKIPDYTFLRADYLKYVDLPDSLKEIGRSAFSECKAITELDLPDGLEIIAQSAFSDCTNLKEALLPDSVTTIGTSAYTNCVNLTTFRYPAGLKTILPNGSSGYIFSGCAKLESITVPEGVTKIPNYTFLRADYLKYVDLPDSLKEIGRSAFSECKAITELDLPDGLEIIAQSAFSDCTNLKEALLPDSVTTIGTSAYTNCVNLTTFRYPAGLKTILPNGSSGYIFSGCAKLESITVPEGVTKIPDYTFLRADYLKYVDLPDSLKEIGRSAFSECKVLEKVYLGYNVEIIGNNAFTKCPDLYIYCEYGSVALDYAKNNGINYYYLSQTGASSPSGSLYRGDPFEIYGYVRSSVNVETVTATIYNSDYSEIIQTITVAPGVTDYSLAGVVNSAMRFGELALGSYHYTLQATALAPLGEELEIFQDTSFTIVPPPLRIYLAGARMPDGIIRASSSIPFSGTIYSNYPITAVYITITSTTTGGQVAGYSSSPNSYQFSIADASSSLGIQSLASDSYVLSISAISNGERRNLYNTNFQKSDYEGTLEDISVDKLKAFVADSNNREIFTTSYIERVIEDMTWVEYGLIGMNHYANGGLFKAIENAIIYHGQDKDLIDAYKADIFTLIDSDAFDQVNYASQIKSRTGTVSSILKTSGKLITSQMPDEMKSTVETINDITGFISRFAKNAGSVAKMESAYETVASVYANIEQGSMILDYIAESISAAKESEFRIALDQVREEYLSAANAALYETCDLLRKNAESVTESMIDHLISELKKSLSSGKTTLEGVIDGRTIAKLVMKTTPMGADAANFDELFARYDMLLVCREGYYKAFDAVAQGDTSTEAMNKLAIAIYTTKAAWIMTQETISSNHLYALNIGNEALAYEQTPKFRALAEIGLPVKQ